MRRWRGIFEPPAARREVVRAVGRPGECRRAILRAGAKPDEAVSWGKVKLTATPVKVRGAATGNPRVGWAVFLLTIAALLHRPGWAPFCPLLACLRSAPTQLSLCPCWSRRLLRLQGLRLHPAAPPSARDSEIYVVCHLTLRTVVYGAHVQGHARCQIDAE